MNTYQKYRFIILLFIFPFFFKAVTIPFELVDGKIIINVNVKNDQYNFIFDSGAFTILSPELKDKVNGKKSNIIFEGVDGNKAKSRMEVLTTDNLQISDIKFKNVNFSFADVSWMSSRACKKISGIFGANMMEGKVWQIDFKNKIITISEEASKIDSGSAMIPFSPENFTSVPKVKVKIRNQILDYIFDTGSGMGFTLDYTSYNLIHDDNFLTFEGLLAQSVNSVSKGERQVDLMETEVNGNNLGPQMIDSNPESRNLIGTRFMENYLVDLDFVNKKIVLHKTDTLPRYDSFGISVAPVGGSLLIVNKLKIPELTELKLKDRIIKVNNIDTGKINSEQFCDIKKIFDNDQKIIVETESGRKITLEKKNVLQYLK